MSQKNGKTDLLFLAITVLFATLAAQPLQAASTVQVGTCLSGVQHYSTIQSAVNGSAPGTTIRVCPGNYPEQVLINKTLTLDGVPSVGGTTPVVVPPVTGITPNATGLGTGESIGAQILVQNASDVNIAGLTVDGNGNLLSACTLDFMGIYYQNASGIVNFVVTRNQNLGAGNECQSGEGIFAQSGYGYSGSSALVIQNSNVYAYQKNGISADGDTLTVTISSNGVIGQGADPYVAQNGIQITGGTKGKISTNSVLNDIYTGSTYSATGILVDASSGLTLTNNTVSNTQGIVIFSGGASGNADSTSLTSNRVIDTDTYDGIDVCSNNNTVVSNTVMGSNQGGIHLDDSCSESGGGSSGNNNIVTENSINNVCAGLLLGSGTGNTISPNSIFNADYTKLAGDSCTAAAVTAGQSVQSRNRRPRVSPVRP